jgi:hypothetical protein
MEGGVPVARCRLTFSVVPEIRVNPIKLEQLIQISDTTKMNEATPRSMEIQSQSFYDMLKTDKSIQ